MTIFCMFVNIGFFYFLSIVDVLDYFYLALIKKFDLIGIDLYDI